MQGRDSVHLPRDFAAYPETKGKDLPSFMNQGSTKKVDFYGNDNDVSRGSDQGLINMEQKLKMAYAD